MTFVQSVLQNINAGFESPVVDIDFVRSRDPDTVPSAFTASCNVLHVMAHGDHTETPMFISSDDRTTISLEDLGVAAAERNRGISTGAIFADGCKTASEQAFDAAERAIEAYSLLTDRSCPYKVMSLTPSRNAKAAFV
jgi:hypothetical protein